MPGKDYLPDTPMKTRRRILDAATALFNDRGTKAVTTNHIAAAAGISPGNLYYHFRNKEEIIRAIFDEMDEYGVAEYGRISERQGLGTAESIPGVFAMIQEFNWRYRFFKREMTALVAADPALGHRFAKTHQAMLILVRGSIDASIWEGMMEAMPEHERQLLAEEIWLVTLFWPNYLELAGESVTADTLRRGSEILRAILRQHATPKGLNALNAAG